MIVRHVTVGYPALYGIAQVVGIEMTVKVLGSLVGITAHVGAELCDMIEQITRIAVGDDIGIGIHHVEVTCA